jgi:hypothetical protein
MGMIGNFLRLSEEDLKRYIEDSSLLEEKLDVLYTIEDDSLTDIDKSWEGIFYLLTGGSVAEKYEDPMAAVMFSNQLIDEEQDLGYGPAHYLTSDQVKDIYSKISLLKADELRKRYNPEKMNEEGIYPEIWDDADGFEYLSEYFETLKDIYSKASANDQAIISFIG